MTLNKQMSYYFQVVFNGKHLVPGPVITYWKIRVFYSAMSFLKCSVASQEYRTHKILMFQKLEIQ